MTRSFTASAALAERGCSWTGRGGNSMNPNIFAVLHPLSAALFVAPFALLVSIVTFVHECGHFSSRAGSA